MAALSRCLRIGVRAVHPIRWVAPSLLVVSLELDSVNPFNLELALDVVGGVVEGLDDREVGVRETCVFADDSNGDHVALSLEVVHALSELAPLAEVGLGAARELTSGRCDKGSTTTKEKGRKTTGGQKMGGQRALELEDVNDLLRHTLLNKKQRDTVEVRHVVNRDNGLGSDE